MKEEQEADKIIEMFNIPYSNHYDSTEMTLDFALLHVNGIIEAMEDFVFKPDYEIRKWKRVKKIIENK